MPVRLRAAAKLADKGVHAVGALALDASLPVAGQLHVPPSRYAAELAALCQCLADGAALPQWIAAYGAPDQRQRAFAAQLRERAAPAVWLGAQAQHAADYATLYLLAAELAKLLGGFHGMLVDGANATGLALVGATPHAGFRLGELERPGLDAKRMIEARLPLYVLLDCEPLDFADPHQARAAFDQAQVISIGSYLDGVRDYADIMLPAASHGEAMATVVNLEGNAVKASPAVLPPGEARPAWKILRVLANLLKVEGFAFEDADQARAKLVASGDFSALLDNNPRAAAAAPPPPPPAAAGGYERLPEVAHFAVDPIVRRAAPLQETQIAQRSNQLSMHPDDLAALGLVAGENAIAAAQDCEVMCRVRDDSRLVRGCVRLPWGNDIFAQLGCAAHVAVRAAALEQQAAGGAR